MPRIKHTKNELKAQRDALRRFERYLPTLELKKQQLQAEVRRVEAALEAKEAEIAEAERALARWVRLFAEPVDLGALIALDQVQTDTANIAGVTIPVFQEVRFRREMPDLYDTPPWVDDGVGAVEGVVRMRVERGILEQQRGLLAEELRITSQRVNLFEKVKIPECRENIRVVRIFLGDEMTAGVARAKIAKAKTVAAARAMG